MGHTKKTYVEVGIKIHSFLISALERGELLTALWKRTAQNIGYKAGWIL